MSAAAEIPPLALTPAQAAKAVNISKPTLYRWMNEPGFPAARIGGCVRIPVDAFRVWLNQRASGTIVSQ